MALSTDMASSFCICSNWNHQGSETLVNHPEPPTAALLLGGYGAFSPKRTKISSIRDLKCGWGRLYLCRENSTARFRLQIALGTAPEHPVPCLQVANTTSHRTIPTTTA